MGINRPSSWFNHTVDKEESINRDAKKGESFTTCFYRHDSGQEVVEADMTSSDDSILLAYLQVHGEAEGEIAKPRIIPSDPSEMARREVEQINSRCTCDMGLAALPPERPTKSLIVAP